MLNELFTKFFSLTKPFDIILSYLNQFANNKLLEYKSIEYSRSRFTKTFLFRENPVDLLDIFHPLVLVTFKNILNKKVKLTIKNATSFLNTNRRILIIGGPGSGKSTIMKLFYIAVYKSKIAYPIKIELRKLNNYEGTLISYLFTEIFDFHKLSVDKFITNQLFTKDKFIFLIDGYDELNQPRRAVILTELDEFIKKYPAHQYVITSRLYTNINSLDGFESFTIKKLGLKEIVDFTNKQLKHLHYAKLNYDFRSLRNFVESSYKDNSNLREFIENPLLLSMFLMMYDFNKDIPLKKSDFYYHAYETIAYLHDNQKREYNRKWPSDLSRQEMLNFMCRFSASTYFGGQVSFSEVQMVFMISSCIEKPTKIDGLLEDLLVSLGLFIKEGTYYYYSHKSFQEFFTALHISKLSIESKARIYEKILPGDKFIENLFQHHNMLSILCELDYHDFTLNFSIPYLKQLFKYPNKIKGNDNSYEKNLLLMYTIVRRIFDQFIVIKDFEKLFSKYFSKFYGDLENEFYLDQNGIYTPLYISGVKISLLGNHLSDLKNSLHLICDELKNLCILEIKKRNNFIDLIQ